MSTLRRITAPLILLLGVVLPVLALPSPAVAGTGSWGDRVGETSRYAPDITRVMLNNNRHRAVVRVALRDAAVEGRVEVFVDSAGAGYPEVVLTGGLGRAPWGAVYRADRWNIGSPYELRCGMRYRRDLRRDVVTFTVNQRCLGNYGRLRVSARAGQYEWTTDWSPAPRIWHPWVRRG